MGGGQAPSQFQSAQDLYLFASNLAASTNAPLLATGHSLGGSLSQLIGAKYGVEATTFNAYGVGNLLPMLGIPTGSFNNITNSLMRFDLVPVLPGSNMIGQTTQYSSAIDIVFARPEIQALAALSGLVFSQLTQNILSSHGIDNFQSSSLATQTGNPVSINIPSPLPAINQLASFLQTYSLVNLITNAFAAASIYVTPVRLDPLVLDLDGDGIETLPINTTTPVMFDLDNSGVKKSVGWIKADDGFLVLDRNGNGTIDTGAELFGDATPLSGGGIAADGFTALAQFDTNLDGQMTASDSAFANLRVWRDLNQNGLSEAGELSTLAALNITSINVAASSHVITVSNGNLITDQGSYTRGDGTVGSVGETANSADVQLATDPFRTTFTTPLTLTAQALTLPDMNGSGQVRNLREAFSSNSTLATLVTQFTQATTSADRRALLDNILKEWSNTSTMSTTFTGAYAGHTLTVNVQGTTSGTTEYQAWADKLTILEHFSGRGSFTSYAANTDWKLVA